MPQFALHMKTICAPASSDHLVATGLAMWTQGRPSSPSGGQYRLEMATRVAAWLAAAIFLIVAAFQAALVFGAPWGEYTQGGGTSGALASSGRLIAAMSCVLSIVMAGAILARAGEGPLRRLPARVVTVLAWVATVYSAVAVVLNSITIIGFVLPTCSQPSGSRRPFEHAERTPRRPCGRRRN
jgi:hypothetical protein